MLIVTGPPDITQEEFQEHYHPELLAADDTLISDILSPIAKYLNRLAYFTRLPLSIHCQDNHDLTGFITSPTCTITRHDTDSTLQAALNHATGEIAWIRPGEEDYPYARLIKARRLVWSL
jgi:hypothetical protein